MLSALLISGAASLVLVPAPPSVYRLRQLCGETRRVVRPSVTHLLAGVPLAAFIGFGIGQAAAAAMAAALAHRMIRQRRTRRESAQAEADVIAALDVMIAELRVGAPPARACRSAAAESPEPTAQVLRQLAGRVELGGEAGIGSLPRGAGADAWEKVVSAWQLADRHGLPIADPLDAIRTDLSARASFASRTHASLAGARATAAVLAGLPGLGIALGQAIGADPVAVLLGDGLGAILLAVGVALGCTGLWWADRITAAAAVLR
jgi:tight adherence protein B